MAIRAFLQGLGATHLFTLSNEGTNTADDLGNSVDPTRIIGGVYSFVTDPVCYGVTHSLLSTTVNNFTSRTQGAIFDNRNDINGSNGAGNDTSAFNYTTNRRTIALWFSTTDFFTPSCVFEQGGGVNNFAIVAGTAKAITFQAADAGTPFLIAQSNFLGQSDRAYLVTGIWRHGSQNASGNEVELHINGVLQEIVSIANTVSFPSHSGDAVVGNTDDSLKSYNEDTVPFATRAKSVNFLQYYNNVGLTVAQSREIFERTVIGENVITGTVAQQQAALDALTGTVFENVNCAIEIRQATDATDYTLELDNIQFVQDANLRDIAIKYVGPNVLTLVNKNGSNAVEVSSPTEQDLDGATILAGGGSIVINNPVPVSIVNIVLNSRVSIKNITTNEIIFNEISPTASVSVSVNYVAGHIYEARARNASSIPAYQPWTQLAGIASTGLQFIASQELD